MVVIYIDEICTWSHISNFHIFKCQVRITWWFKDVVAISAVWLLIKYCAISIETCTGWAFKNTASFYGYIFRMGKYVDIIFKHHFIYISIAYGHLLIFTIRHIEFARTWFKVSICDVMAIHTQIQVISERYIRHIAYICSQIVVSTFRQ